MRQIVDKKSNDLLSALDEKTWEHLSPHIKKYDLKLGQVIYESGEKLKYTYFPINAIISLIFVAENGASTEIAIVGHEGMVGVPVFMGGDSTSSRGVVQSAGQCYAINSKALKTEFENSKPLMHVLLRYSQALLTQMSQTAVCNRHHTIDQQLCRWLLLSIDCLEGNELVMTHELIADMLGVRRGGVTLAAQKLQQAGLIKYNRGRITVLDRAGLERRTCECYSVVEKEYKRLLYSYSKA